MKVFIDKSQTTFSAAVCVFIYGKLRVMVCVHINDHMQSLSLPYIKIETTFRNLTSAFTPRLGASTKHINVKTK